MGYVQFILDSRTKAQAATSPAPVVLNNLPGLHRREGMIADAQSRAKVEYTDATNRLRALNRKLKSTSGEEKKEMQAAIARTKDHRESLLKIIGIYTKEEALFGFKEDKDAF
jgi:hypothetical protein